MNMAVWHNSGAVRTESRERIEVTHPICHRCSKSLDGDTLIEIRHYRPIAAGDSETRWKFSCEKCLTKKETDNLMKWIYSHQTSLDRWAE